MIFISDVQNYVPIKLCKTVGSIHLFKIMGTLKAEIKLIKNYLWDTLEIDWKEVTVTDKRRKLIPTKRYKVLVVAKPKSTLKTCNTTMQPPITAPSAPINSEKANPPQEGTSDSNPPTLKSILAHAGTPWPKAGKMSGNLFELRKD